MIMESQLYSGLDFSSLQDLIGFGDKFCLRFHGTCKSICCLSYEIKPEGEVEGHSLICSSKPQFFSCCRNASRAMSLSKGVGETRYDTAGKLTFSWNNTCCGDERVVDIFMPREDDRFGWISGNEIHSPLTNQIFTMTKTVNLLFLNAISGEFPLYLKIVNSQGETVATASTSKWFYYRSNLSVKEYQFHISELIPISTPAKAILLVAFIMWVIEYDQKDLVGWYKGYFFAFILLTIFIVYLLFGRGIFS